MIGHWDSSGSSFFMRNMTKISGCWMDKTNTGRSSWFTPSLFGLFPTPMPISNKCYDYVSAFNSKEDHDVCFEIRCIVEKNESFLCWRETSRPNCTVNARRHPWQNGANMPGVAKYCSMLRPRDLPALTTEGEKEQNKIAIAPLS